MQKILTMDDSDFKGKTVLVRVDFNSPVDPKTKHVLDDTRIRAHAETTIEELIKKRAPKSLFWLIRADLANPTSFLFVSMQRS